MTGKPIHLIWWNALNNSEKDLFTRIVIGEKTSFKNLKENQIIEIYKYNKTSKK